MSTEFASDRFLAARWHWEGRCLVVIGLSVLLAGNVPAADQYFAGDGSALNAAKWGTSAAGPFTGNFTNGNNAWFSVPNGTGAGMSAQKTFGGIYATENFTMTSVGMTINLTGIVDVDVSTGKTLHFGLQAFTTATGTGMNKKGDGTLALGATSSDMPGGFTLTSGTVVMLGANGMGNGGLTINGGTIAASASLDLSGRYSAGNQATLVGGDFTFGSSVGPAVSSANLTFTSQWALQNPDHTISIGGSGTYTLGGTLSLSETYPNTNLTVNGSGGGKLFLKTGSNIDGTLTVSQAKLQIEDGVNYATQIVVNNGGTLLLSGSAPFSKLNDSAPVELGGSGSGRIDLTGITATHDEKVGTLTLSDNSIIDFGTLAGGNTFRFDQSSSLAWPGMLSIYNWTMGADHLYFGTDDSTGLTSSQLSRISFYSGNGTGFLGTPSFLPGGLGEIAVPEPSALIVALGLLGWIGWREHRQLRMAGRKLGETRSFP